jgi:crotonobetainyl-CoA:carnitine CoA-transferase CaiB-like acyl-CoA transferase
MHDEQGSWLTYGSPLFLSGSPMVEPTRAGRLGADTESILTDELALSADDVAALRRTGAI